MTQKAKGSAEGATSQPSQISNPTTGMDNMQTNNTQNAGGATELPEQKVRRLAKEISAALDEIEDYKMVMVFPASSQQFSVQICLDSEFAHLMQRVRALREGDM